MDALEELRSNQRLRLGLAAILAILLAYGLLDWRDRIDVAKTEYRRLLGQVVRVEQIQQPEVWQQRAKESQAALAQARTTVWRNASTGQAQAQVQDLLGALLRQTDAKGSALRVTEPEAALDTASVTAKLPESLKGLKLLRARVEFTTDPAVLMALLAALNDAEHRVVVDVLTVKPFKTELVLTFWFELVPAPPLKEVRS